MKQRETGNGMADIAKQSMKLNDRSSAVSEAGLTAVQSQGETIETLKELKTLLTARVAELEAGLRQAQAIITILVEQRDTAMMKLAQLQAKG